jgi:hypothetical protein
MLDYLENNKDIYFCFDKLENNILNKSNEQNIYRNYNTIYDNKIIQNIYARKIIPTIMQDKIEDYIKINNNTNIHIINNEDGEADSFMFNKIHEKSYMITQDGDIVISFLLRGYQDKDLYENTQLVLWRHEPNINFNFIEYNKRNKQGEAIKYVSSQDDENFDNDDENYDSDDEFDINQINGGGKEFDINAIDFKPSIYPADFPLKMLILLLYNSTDAGYGNKMNISEIEKIIKKYNKMINCYKYINAINMNKIAIKCKNVMKKFIATITLLLYGWGIETQIKEIFKTICPYIEDIIQIINEKSKNKLLCTVYPYDEDDICNLLILLMNKNDFIKLFNQELDILLNYEKQLEQLNEVCKRNNIIPSMVLIYCVRHENYEICKTNYTATIKYINDIPKDINYEDMMKILRSEIQQLEKIYEYKIFQVNYKDIMDEINQYKMGNKNYLDTLDGINLLLFYLHEIFNGYSDFISKKTPSPQQTESLRKQQESFEKIYRYIYIIQNKDFIEYNKINPITECNFNTIETKLMRINQSIIGNRENIKKPEYKFITQDLFDPYKNILDVDKKVLYVPLELLIQVNESLNK